MLYYIPSHHQPSTRCDLHFGHPDDCEWCECARVRSRFLSYRTAREWSSMTVRPLFTTVWVCVCWIFHSLSTDAHAWFVAYSAEWGDTEWARGVSRELNWFADENYDYMDVNESVTLTHNRNQKNTNAMENSILRFRVNIFGWWLHFWVRRYLGGGESGIWTKQHIWSINWTYTENNVAYESVDVRRMSWNLAGSSHQGKAKLMSDVHYGMINLCIWWIVTFCYVGQ